MEVMLQRAVFFGKITVDRGRKIAFGQTMQGFSERFDNFALAGLRFALFLLGLVAGLGQGFQIDADGHVHIQHHALA